MAAKKEVENVTRQRMVNRHDIAKYEAAGWKFISNKGSQSALMEITEKKSAPVVPSAPAVEQKEPKS